jgi:glucokinase
MGRTRVSTKNRAAIQGKSSIRMIAIGVEIGGTKLQAISFDGNVEVNRRRRTVDVQAGALKLRDELSTMIRELVQSLRANNTVEAIGVGFGGPVDWRTGTIVKSFHVHGWNGFPLGKWLSDLFSCRVVVDNDSNIAAFGEASLGNGKSFSSVLYSNVGSGIGAGFVQDRNIYHGSQPGELELGHIRISKLGDTVESRCSGWAIDRRIREFAIANPQSILGQLYQQKNTIESERLGGEAALLRPALKESDADAEAIVDEAARTYAWALSHAVHLLSPEVIVLGGGLSLLGDPWRFAVQGHLRSFLMDAFLPGPEVRLASLGEDVVPVGAACYAIVQNREGVQAHG